jgi:hypothetical protein
MKHRSLPMLTAMALCACVSCAKVADAGGGSDPWPEEIIDSMDDQRLVVFLPTQDIATSPQWLPADGAPPLNIAGAVEQLKKWMASDPRYRGAEIHEIELKPIHHHEHEHRWYYLFQLRHPHAGRHNVLYGAVLLNGKVIPVLAEPSPIK